MELRALMAAALIFGATTVAGCRSDTDRVADNRESELEAMPRPGVTLANYDRLGTGAATYEDASITFGSAGKLQESSEMGGKKIETYIWSSDDASGRVNAIFENGRLVSKSQYGLR